MQDTIAKQICACPLNGKACRDGIREDFDPGLKCRWWQHLYGKDPQTEKVIDQWDCAVAWLPVTTIETSQMSRQTAASVDKVANQYNAIAERLSALGKAIRVAAESIRQGIESGALHVMLPPPGGGHKSQNGEDRHLKEGETE